MRTLIPKKSGKNGVTEWAKDILRMSYTLEQSGDAPPAHPLKAKHGMTFVLSSSHSIKPTYRFRGGRLIIKGENALRPDI